MDTVFIVRPFGNKRPVIKKNKEGVPEIVFFDFDKVEDLLIKPAIKALDLKGGTTLKIFESGEIKEDMFSQLLIADIVIADITIHNANVFYELGIRHALRCKTTVLIKGSGFDETPFDILGYRYIDYQSEDPAAATDTLIEFLKQSPLSSKKDSPVFNMLPKLAEQEIENFVAIPPDFNDEVSVASASKRVGYLLLLAREAAFFSWELPALRLIGEELFRLKALDAARILWEKVKSEKIEDVQANDRLATIYQRLAEREMKSNSAEGLALLAKSDLAIQSLLNIYENLDMDKRAQVYALKGRNAKTRWINAWKDSPAEKKPVEALQSTFLETAFKNYENGYFENLNHFYSGINALGLLTTKIKLAEQNAQIWSLSFDSDEEGARKLSELKEKRQKLATSIEFSLMAERRRLEESGRSNIWLKITEADFKCLTSARPASVAISYRQVREEAGEFEIHAVTGQLKIYEQLNVLSENVQASLGAIGHVQKASAEIRQHFLLFTGHMIDRQNRGVPRFPEEKESVVREKIKERITEERTKNSGTITGIAGGASGGDILFHEVCMELGIPTELYLALPPDKFKAESVAFAGVEWVERFDNLYKKIPHHTLCDTKELPAWLQKKSDYNIWERNNLWALNSALVNGGMEMTLLALWDGRPGDGIGGTEHMVKEARERGAKVLIIGMDLL